MIKSIATLSALTAIGLLLNCSADPLPCDFTKTCESAAPGGDASPDVALPPGCTNDADPKDSPACVSESAGLFVNGADGNDDAAGTRAAPLKTIMAAVMKSTAGHRVFVCEGTYAENVRVGSSIGLVGGYSCGSWNHEAKVVTIAPTSPGPALEIADATSKTIISDLKVQASPPTQASRSSVGIFIRTSQILGFRIGSIAADGLTGDNAPPFTTNFDLALTSSSAVLVGKTAAGTAGGGSNECATLCANNEHATGGGGGMGTLAPTAGEAGKPDRGAGLGGLQPGTLAWTVRT